MSTLAANECRRQLRYNFTDPERIDKAKALAEALNRSAATESELSRIKSDYKARLESIQAEVDLLNGAVLSGYELREYVCFFTYDDPRPGRKTLRKREGMDIVGEEDMTERDRQMVMDILDKQAAEATPPPAEKLALPAPKQFPTEVIEVMLDDQERGSFDYNEESCIEFAGFLHGIFVGITDPADGGQGYLLEPDARDEELSDLLKKHPADTLEAFVGWLREDPRPSIPGTSWVADAVAAHLRGLAIEADKKKARDAAAKKAARKGRQSGGPGTVDIPSDEGSRDDAGPDAKTKL